MVKGRGNESGISAGTSSSGSPPSRYCFSLQLLSVAPAVEKTALTESVSTTTSRATLSATIGVAAGTFGTDDAGAAVVAGEAGLSVAAAVEGGGAGAGMG